MHEYINGKATSKILEHIGPQFCKVSHMKKYIIKNHKCFVEEESILLCLYI